MKKHSSLVTKYPTSLSCVVFCFLQTTKYGRRRDRVCRFFFTSYLFLIVWFHKYRQILKFINRFDDLTTAVSFFWSIRNSKSDHREKMWNNTTEAAAVHDEEGRLLKDPNDLIVCSREFYSALCNNFCKQKCIFTRILIKSLRIWKLLFRSGFLKKYHLLKIGRGPQNLFGLILIAQFH